MSTKNNADPAIYKPLLSLVIGWNILAYWTGIHWIGYIALLAGFAGIVSETFAEKLMLYIHSILLFIFSLLQKVFITFIYFLIITPISILKRRGKRPIQKWFHPTQKDSSQLEKLW